MTRSGSINDTGTDDFLQSSQISKGSTQQHVRQDGCPTNQWNGTNRSDFEEPLSKRFDNKRFD